MNVTARPAVTARYAVRWCSAEAGPQPSTDRPEDTPKRCSCGQDRRRVFIAQVGQASAAHLWTRDRGMDSGRLKDSFLRLFSDS